MNSSSAKLAAAAVVTLAGIILAASLWHGTGAGIALAEVLDHLQRSSYSFDLTIRSGDAQKTVRGSVYQQGRARFDDTAGPENATTIVNLESRKSLLLLHPSKTVRYTNGLEQSRNTGTDQLLLLCSRPIEELWRLRTGAEDDLGEATVEGMKAHGFTLAHQDAYFRNEITLWAQVNSGLPLKVEIVSTALKPPGNQLVFTLENFLVDPDPDKSLFSMAVPSGYALSNLMSRSDVKPAAEDSQEGKKIAAALRLWANGQTNEGVESILDVDWNAQITFENEPYVLTLTEPDLVKMKQDEREQVMPVVLESCNMLRKMCFELIDRAKTGQSAGDYQAAERTLEAALHLGELLNRDPEGMHIVQLVGIAMRKLSLVQLKALYEQMNAPEKLVTTEQKIQQVDADHQALQRKNVGR
ncbi:MAG: hypothetical protein JW955_25315 [Sedimentisphaerales bacterium]|nr:hypothetical protein [Sedimentisphaerales bacterium]